MEEIQTVDIASKAENLKTKAAGCKLSFNWWTAHKSLNESEKAIFANAFNADSKLLTAGKKLVDIKHPLLKAINKVKSEIVQYWMTVTLPYVEDSIRLLRQDRIPAFNVYMTTMKAELKEAVHNLAINFDVIKEEAKERLQNLYDEKQYPNNIEQLYDVNWCYPNLSPPSYLMELDPETYQKEHKRVQSQFEEAVKKAEQELRIEFAETLDALVERLKPDEDGNRKVFKAASVDNIKNFFTKFKDLNITNDIELAKLVEQTESLLSGVNAQMLRSKDDLKDKVSSTLEDVLQTLDTQIITLPNKRLIKRKKKQQQEQGKKSDANNIDS